MPKTPSGKDRDTGEPTRERRESGEPGGGQGRRDPVDRSGVYPPGAPDIPPDAEVRMAGTWGGGPYEESGGSELVYRDGELLGGLTAGPSGEPTGEESPEEDATRRPDERKKS